MIMETAQQKFWKGSFASGYLKRNFFNRQQLDRVYVRDYGVTRTAMQEEFLKSVPKSARILEVGANVGNTLLSLQAMGYTNLYGIELNPHIVEAAHRRLPGLNIIEGNVLDMPFKDGFFDLVYTSDVLIHVSPKNIKKAVSEITRCSKKFIWGFEYHAPTYTEISYRGHSGVLWKTDFPKVYLSESGAKLSLVKRKFYPYLATPELVDCMFLLRKAVR